MIAIRQFLTLLIFCCTITTAAGQDVSGINMLRTAELKSFGRNAMIQGDYHTATLYLDRYMQRRPDNEKGALWLAESYRKSRDYEASLAWYETAFKLSDQTNAEAAYYQGIIKKMYGDCDAAREFFTKFRKLAGSDEESTNLKRQMRAEIAGCDSIVGNKSLQKLAITRLDTTINKPHVEAAPLYLDNSTLIYTSLRVEEPVYRIENDTAKLPVRTMYMSKKKNTDWYFGGEYAALEVPAGANVSSATISPDGKRMYYSVCQSDWKNKMVCMLWLSEKEGEAWGAPKDLGKAINLKGSSNTQPAIARTSKDVEIVYFVSDRKGGKGGTDIWYFTWNEKRKIFTTPRNAGSAINTRQDELAPWYDQEYRTLYFSSEGHPGVGGHDIYRSYGEVRKFTKPENLKQPINSGFDDLHYVIAPDRQHGMFTSNRKGGSAFKNQTCCDDLYEFTRLEHVVINLSGLLAGEDSIKKTPINNGRAELYLVEPSTGEAVLLKTLPLNEKGEYKVQLESGHTYKITGAAEGYLKKSETITTEGVVVSANLRKDVFLPKLSYEGYRLENVYYETDKHDLTAQSKAVLDTTLLILLLENPEIKIEIGAHTDDVGTDSYNMGLSQRRAEGVVKYLIEKGIPKNRLSAKGYGETKPVEPNFKPDGTPDVEARSRNRRTEFRVVGTMPVKVVRDEEEDY